MLNSVTKTGWLFAITFVILLSGCAGAPNTLSDNNANAISRPPEYIYAIELLKRKEYDKALEVFLSLESKYDNADVYTNIAIIYLNKNQYITAKTYIEKSIVLNSENDIAQNVYGVILRNLGELDKSVQAYNKSITINSKNAYSYLNLAILLDIFIDSPKDALYNYEKYAEYMPEDKEVEKWIIEVKRRVK